MEKNQILTEINQNAITYKMENIFEWTSHNDSIQNISIKIKKQNLEYSLSMHFFYVSISKFFKWTCLKWKEKHNILYYIYVTLLFFPETKSEIQIVFYLKKSSSSSIEIWFKIGDSGVPITTQWLTNLRTMRLRVGSLALLNGLRIWRCCELRCRLHMQLESHAAVGVA